MKVLVLDNPEYHKNGFTGETGEVYRHISQQLSCLDNEEAELAKTFSEADARLQKRGIELVIIHHTNFKEVEFLKRKYPDVLFWGYSNALVDRENCPPRTYAAKFRDDFEKAYDFVTENTFFDLKDFLEKRR
ncbi:MAG: hypothetical protein ABIH28_00985 [archaeon]